MRLINRLDIEAEITVAWTNESQAALNEIRALSRKDRAAAINARQHIWKNLKSALAKVSANKCWYCESTQTRSDLAVDHFRPKNSVAEAAGDFAYWWLAFDWQNYRYSCTWCNSRRTGDDGTTGGKGDHFPLMTEGLRGTPEDSVSMLDGKEPVKLLDPLKFADVALLTFDDDGKPVSVPSRTEDLIAFERVTVSIELYHLDEEKLCKQRKFKMIEVRNLVRQFAKHQDNDTFLAIHQRIRPAAEHSAACRAAVRGLRGETAFAQALLDAV